MDFYLHYDGELPASPDNPTSTKNSIRQQFHFQLRELWGKDQVLKSVWRSTRGWKDENGQSFEARSIDLFADKFARPPYRFIPLVCDDLGNICNLEILFFRREDNRALIKKTKDYGGDLDNRLKILFDGLRIPDQNQLAGLNLPPDDRSIACSKMIR